MAELENAASDANHVRMLCTVPFKSGKAKKDHRKKLDVLRDNSQRAIVTLHAMTGGRSRLQITKAARDKIDDSFWDNSDLELVPDRGVAKLAEYQFHADAHVKELLTVMRNNASEDRLSFLEEKGKMKELGPGPAGR